MVEATGRPRERLCTACFTGEYPVPLPQEILLGETDQPVLPFEVTQRSSVDLEAVVPRLDLTASDAEGVATGVAGGAGDALGRP